MALAREIWHRVEAMAAERVAAAKPGKREPAALPRPVRVDGLPRIVRATRQMPAVHAKQGRDGKAIERNRGKQQRPCDPRAERRAPLPALADRFRHALPSGVPSRRLRAWPRSLRWRPPPRR